MSIVKQGFFAFKVVGEDGFSPFAEHDQKQFLKSKKHLPRIKGRLEACRNGYHLLRLEDVSGCYGPCEGESLWLVRVPKGARVLGLNRKTGAFTDKFIVDKFSFVCKVNKQQAEQASCLFSIYGDKHHV